MINNVMIEIHIEEVFDVFTGQKAGDRVSIILNVAS